MGRRVHYDSDAQPNMGDGRSTSVWVDFSAETGLEIRGSDCASWPSRDYLWHINVAAEQARALRDALEAPAGTDTLDALVSRFVKESYGFWLNFSSWLDQHGIQYSRSSRWADN